MNARNDQGSDWPICLARLLKPPFLPLPFLPFFFSGGSPPSTAAPVFDAFSLANGPFFFIAFAFFLLEAAIASAGQKVQAWHFQYWQ